MDLNIVLKDCDNSTGDKSIIDVTVPTPFDINRIESKYWSSSNLPTLAVNNSVGDIVLHLNIQSLPAKYDNFQTFLYLLMRGEISPALIGLTETWLNSHNKAAFSLNGYHPLIARCREDESSRGGVGLFVREDLEFDERPDLEVFIPFVF